MKGKGVDGRGVIFWWGCAAPHFTYAPLTHTPLTHISCAWPAYSPWWNCPEFLRRAKAIMPDDDSAALIDCIAANPEAGVSLGGGLRKVLLARYGDRP